MRVHKCATLRLSALDAKIKSDQLGRHQILAQKLWKDKYSLWTEPVKICVICYSAIGKWCTEQRVYIKNFGLKSQRSALVSCAGRCSEFFSLFLRSSILKQCSQKTCCDSKPLWKYWILNYHTFKQGETTHWNKAFHVDSILGQLSVLQSASYK